MANLDIFQVQKVQLRFDIPSDFVAAQVANNVLILALATGRILRFDLDNDADIDDIDFLRRVAEVGTIHRLFLDPSASHLIITTTAGENFYLHSQSRQPRPLHRLKGQRIESIAWNPLQPTASTREILIGTRNGDVFEICIDGTSTKQPERYVTLVHSSTDGTIVGLLTDVVKDYPDLRHLVLASRNKLSYIVGKLPVRPVDSAVSTYRKFFEENSVTAYSSSHDSGASSCFAVSPQVLNATMGMTGREGIGRSFAWQCSDGIRFADIPGAPSTDPNSANNVSVVMKLIPTSIIAAAIPGTALAIEPDSMTIALTNYHLLVYWDGWLVGINRLTEEIVFTQQIAGQGQRSLDLLADHQKNTFWLFMPRMIYEIVVVDEGRDVWEIMLRQGRYEMAASFARTQKQRNVIAMSNGERLLSLGRYLEAADILGACDTPFEDVSLRFTEHRKAHALRRYLLVKMAHLDESATIQRTLIITWVVDLFMKALNDLEATIIRQAELHKLGSIETESDGVKSSTKQSFANIQAELYAALDRYAHVLDKSTTYSIIGAHGRDVELLYFATAIKDFDYVVTYKINRGQWSDAMSSLRAHPNSNMIEKHGTVLMAHAPHEFVELLMRQPNVNIVKIIPALLEYNKTFGTHERLQSNQAVRFLRFCIDTMHSEDLIVHNTLVSLYVANSMVDESTIMHYLRSYQDSAEQPYDKDFALRLCIAHGRVQSATHIYILYKHYSAAVEFALKHNRVDIAADVADIVVNNDVLCKKLWLKIARKVIHEGAGIRAAIEVANRCRLVKIEDLVPFFPDFIIIDAFKEEVCAALEAYSRQIEDFRKEMDDSSETAQNIREQVSALDRRYAIIMPGERCWVCHFPLLARQFFVFPCQHAFHADCLGKTVVRSVNKRSKTRIKQLQDHIGQGIAVEDLRELMVNELDSLIAGQCILCSDTAIKEIEQPFVNDIDCEAEWAVQ